MSTSGSPPEVPDHSADPAVVGSEPKAVGSKERVFVGTGLFWSLIVGVLLATVVMILVAQNTGSVTMAFLGWDFSTSLIVLLLGALLIGVVLDELFGLVFRARRRRVMGDRDHLDRLTRSRHAP